MSLNNDSHILALRRIIEGVKTKNLKATMVFKKAFDSVHRDLLVKILKAYGIQELLIVSRPHSEDVHRHSEQTSNSYWYSRGIRYPGWIAGKRYSFPLVVHHCFIVIDFITTLSTDDDDSEYEMTLRP